MVPDLIQIRDERDIRIAVFRLENYGIFYVF